MSIWEFITNLEKNRFQIKLDFFFEFELDFYCLCSLQKSIWKSNWFSNLIFQNWKKIEWHSIFQKSSGDRQGVWYTKLVVQRTPSPLYHRLSRTEQLTIPYNNLHCSEHFSFLSLLYSFVSFPYFLPPLHYSISPYPELGQVAKNHQKLNLLCFFLNYKECLQHFNKF